MTTENQIVVGKGWKESERPGELYVSYKRWTWAETEEIACLLFEQAIKRVKQGDPRTGARSHDAELSA